jgi:hypothetical protein
MDRAWSIRDFRDGDEGEINELFNSVFVRRRALNNWYWKFTRNPEGSSMVNAVDGSGIVGHLGGLNRQVAVRGKEHSALLEVDGMTRADYGRQGIFTELGKQLLSKAKDNGVCLAYGFPNEHAMPGHRKLGCVELFKLNVLIKPIHYDKLSEKAFSSKIGAFFGNLAQRIAFTMVYRTRDVEPGKDVVLKKVEELDSRFDELWNRAKKAHNIVLRRDSTYLNWRYIQCPEGYYAVYAAEKKGEILAWVIVRTMERFGLKNGMVADMMSLPDHVDVLCTLIQMACEELKKRDVDLIACSVPKGSHYFRALRQCGFMPCPDRLNPRDVYFIVYILSEKIQRNAVSDPANWFVTWGDTDVV